MFLSDNQIRILRRIADDCDETRLITVLHSMLERDVIRSGKITVSDRMDYIIIRAYRKVQKVMLKV